MHLYLVLDDTSGLACVHIILISAHDCTAGRWYCTGVFPTVPRLGAINENMVNAVGGCAFGAQHSETAALGSASPDKWSARASRLQAGDRALQRPCTLPPRRLSLSCSRVMSPAHGACQPRCWRGGLRVFMTVALKACRERWAVVALGCDGVRLWWRWAMMALGGGGAGWKWR